MQKVSKAFYLGSIAGVGGLGTIVWLIGNLEAQAEGEVIRPVFLGLGIPLSLYAGIVGLTLWHKAWSSIQGKHARTTPGKAIGYVFIPFFNFYWIFQAFLGFAKDHNSYVSEHRPSAPKLNEGLFMAFCVLTLVGVILNFIPFVGPVFSLVTFGLWVGLASKVCDAINEVASIAETGDVPAAQALKPAPSSERRAVNVSRIEGGRSPAVPAAAEPFTIGIWLGRGVIVLSAAFLAYVVTQIVRGKMPW